MSTRKRKLVIALTVLVALALCVCLIVSLKKVRIYDRVVIIGVDGAGGLYMDIGMPCVSEIFDPENVTCSMKSVSPPLSAQNWGTMMYGVLPEEHGLTNDKLKQEAFKNDKYHSIFYLVHQKYPEASIASIVGWTPINYGMIDCRDDMILIPGELEKKSRPNSKVVEDVLNYLSANDPKLLFVHFDNVDQAGHAEGWGSSKYIEALLAVDQDIGTIWRALDDKGCLDNTLFIVVSDHGGLDKNHKGDSSEEMTAFFAVAGRGLDNGKNIGEMGIADVRAVVLRALGIKDTDGNLGKIPSGIFSR